MTYNGTRLDSEQHPSCIEADRRQARADAVNALSGAVKHLSSTQQALQWRASVERVAQFILTGEWPPL